MKLPTVRMIRANLSGMDLVLPCFLFAMSSVFGLLIFFSSLLLRTSQYGTIATSTKAALKVPLHVGFILKIVPLALPAQLPICRSAQRLALVIYH